MTSSDYLGLALSFLMLGIGLPAALGRIRSVPRRESWLPLTMGAATLLYVILETREVPGEFWLHWLVPLLMTGGLVITWWLRRRDKRSPIGQSSAP